MKSSFILALAFTLATVVLSAAIGQYRDPVGTEKLQAVDAINTYASHSNTTATGQTGSSCIGLRWSESYSSPPNGTYMDAAIKKGGGRPKGKGWRWGVCVEGSGSDSNKKVSVFTVLLCAIMATLISAW